MSTAEHPVIYLVGPNDTREHSALVSELEEGLKDIFPEIAYQSIDAETFQDTEDLVALVRGVTLLILAKPKHKWLLDRLESFLFTLFVQRLGMQGVLNYTFKVNTSPVRVTLTQSSGSLDVQRSA